MPLGSKGGQGHAKSLQGREWILEVEDILCCRGFAELQNGSIVSIANFQRQTENAHAQAQPISLRLDHSTEKERKGADTY